MSRSFTIEAVYKNGHKLSFDGGRYISNAPSSAVRKAFTQVYRHIGATGKMTLVIHIRETTQNSSTKTYKYKVSRIKKPTAAYWIQGSVVFEYTTKVKAI